VLETVFDVAAVEVVAVAAPAIAIGAGIYMATHSEVFARASVRSGLNNFKNKPAVGQDNHF
jgi:hypothetical protein